MTGARGRYFSKSCTKMLLIQNPLLLLMIGPWLLLTDDSEADAVVFGGALSEIHSAGELAWNMKSKEAAS